MGGGFCRRAAGWCGNSIAMEGGKGVVGIRDLFRWVGDGRESSSGQKGGGTKDLAVLELLFPGPWVTGGGRDERPRRSPFELR